MPRGQGETVVVLEDDPDVRQLAVKLVASLGYQVIDVPEAKSAWAVLQRGEQVDLVLSDVVMPQMGGYDLAEAMTAQGHAVPLALISGYAPGSEDPNAAGLPRITKPFSMTELLAFVAQHIAEKPPLTA